MKRLVLVGLLAACSRELSDGYPINPGGGGSSTTHSPDAPAASDDGGTMINGRVCYLLATPQTLTTCAPSGAGNLTVTLGSAMTTTADDGSFTLTRPAITTNLVWRVTGTTIKPAAIKFGTTTTLPAIDLNVYEQDMLVSTDATVVTGSGAIMMRVTHVGSAVMGATVMAAPAPDSGQIFYDGASVTAWEQDATGTYGVAWMPSIAVGSVNLTITSGATDTTVMAQPVFADTITFVLAEIP